MLPKDPQIRSCDARGVERGTFRSMREWLKKRVQVAPNMEAGGSYPRPQCRGRRTTRRAAHREVGRLH